MRGGARRGVAEDAQRGSTRVYVHIHTYVRTYVYVRMERTPDVYLLLTMYVCTGTVPYITYGT